MIISRVDRMWFVLLMFAVTVAWSFSASATDDRGQYETLQQQVTRLKEDVAQLEAIVNAIASSHPKELVQLVIVNGDKQEPTDLMDEETVRVAHQAQTLLAKYRQQYEDTHGRPAETQVE